MESGHQEREPEAVPSATPLRQPRFDAPKIFPSDGREHGLDPAVMRVWRIAGLITILVFFLIFSLVEFIWLGRQRWYPLPPMVFGAGVPLLLGLPSLALIRRSYRAWRFALTPTELIVSFGVFWRVKRYIPRPRIQHVDISSGPILRMFGLVELSLYTAGSLGAVVEIPGLPPREAEALRQALVGQE